MKIKNRLLQGIANLYRDNETRIHELTYLFWECTRRCNLRCLHCGSDCVTDSRTPDLPFEDFLKAILPLKEFYDSDKITVAVTGGEPLLRDDLPACGETLRRHGFHYGIVTNGYAYTPEVHKSLIDSGMGTVTLSLDGMEASHNWLRNNEQSFSRAVRALDLIVSSKYLTYDVVTCVNKRNVGELERLKEFLIERHTAAWRLFTITPIGRAAAGGDLRLSPKELKRLMDFIAEARADKRMNTMFSCEAYVGDYERKVRDGHFFCRAGINIASVLIDGSISACPNINRSFIQGNIYRDSFVDVWENGFEIMRDRRWTQKGICKNCKAHRHCRGGAMHQWNDGREAVLNCIHRQISGRRTDILLFDLLTQEKSTEKADYPNVF